MFESLGQLSKITIPGWAPQAVMKCFGVHISECGFQAARIGKAKQASMAGSESRCRS